MAALEYRRTLLAHDAMAQRRLLRRFAHYHTTIRAEVRRLEGVLATGGDMTRSEIIRLERWRALDYQVKREAQRFVREWGDGLEASALWAADLGGEAAMQEALAGYAIGDHEAVSVAWHRLHTQAVVEALGYFEPGSPLMRRLATFPTAFAEHLEAAILDGLALGYNPRRVARDVARATGQSLDWASRWTRTAHMQAYRGAHRESFAANSDVVGSWVWMAHLDGRVCASCVAMHGTEHPIDEQLDDHWNGRCVPLPKVRPVAGIEPLPLELADSEAWLRRQSQETQERILGIEGRARWLAGARALRDFSMETDDRVWGRMRVVRPLRRAA